MVTGVWSAGDLRCAYSAASVRFGRIAPAAWASLSVDPAGQRNPPVQVMMPVASTLGGGSARGDVKGGAGGEIAIEPIVPIEPAVPIEPDVPVPLTAIEPMFGVPSSPATATPNAVLVEVSTPSSRPPLATIASRQLAYCVSSAPTGVGIWSSGVLPRRSVPTGTFRQSEVRNASWLSGRPLRRCHGVFPSVPRSVSVAMSRNVIAWRGWVANLVPSRMFAHVVPTSGSWERVILLSTAPPPGIVVIEPAVPIEPEVPMVPRPMLPVLIDPIAPIEPAVPMEPAVPIEPEVP